MTEPRDRRKGFETVGKRLDEEAEKLIAYLNDEVVPQVRDHSSRALRIAAEKLKQFADYMDERQKSAPTESQHKDGSGI